MDGDSGPSQARSVSVPAQPHTPSITLSPTLRGFDRPPHDEIAPPCVPFRALTHRAPRRPPLSLYLIFSHSLFKRFSEAASEPPSSCELPYDPMKRYNALNKTKSLKLPKGHKSPEHLENLRKSDPLINLWAWHDYNELHAKHINTRAARDKVPAAGCV